MTNVHFRNDRWHNKQGWLRPLFNSLAHSWTTLDGTFPCGRYSPRTVTFRAHKKKKNCVAKFVVEYQNKNFDTSIKKSMLAWYYFVWREGGSWIVGKGYHCCDCKERKFSSCAKKSAGFQLLVKVLGRLLALCLAPRWYVKHSDRAMTIGRDTLCIR
jgi:hypothetical protein